MVLWSVLRYPRVLGCVLLQPVSLLALQVDWLVSAWCAFLAGGDFGTDFSS